MNYIFCSIYQYWVISILVIVFNDQISVLDHALLYHQYSNIEHTFFLFQITLIDLLHVSLIANGI